MRNKYLYKNIIRKQKMLNEKHEDIMKIKCKQQLKMLNYKNYENSMFSNASRLFTSGYLHELANDPSYARALEADDGSNDSCVVMKSHYLNFNWCDRSDTFIDPINKQNSGYPVRGLNEILQSVLMKESEISISDTIHCSEAEKLFNDESFNKEHVLNIDFNNYKPEQIVKKNLPINQSKSPSISEFTASRNIQVSANSKINQKNLYRTAQNKDESATSTCRNSNDIKEHPSVDESKQEKYPTKDKYQKYLGKRRSASKGVFNYLDCDKPCISNNVLKDIQNNLISPKTPCPNYDKNTDCEKASLKQSESSSKLMQNSRHLRTNTLLGSNITEDGLKTILNQLNHKTVRDFEKIEINKIQNQLNRDLCYEENYDDDQNRKMTLDYSKKRSHTDDKGIFIDCNAQTNDHLIINPQVKTPKTKSNCKTFRAITNYDLEKSTKHCLKKNLRKKYITCRSKSSKSRDPISRRTSTEGDQNIKFTSTVQRTKISRLKAKKNKSCANHLTSKSSKRTDDENCSAKRIQDVKSCRKKFINDFGTSSNTSQTGLLAQNFNQTVKQKSTKCSIKQSSKLANKIKSDLIVKGAKCSTINEPVKSPLQNQNKIDAKNPDRSKKIKGILKVHSRKPSELTTNCKTFYNNEATRNELRHSKSKKSIGCLNLESISYVSPKEKTEFKLQTPNNILSSDIILDLNKHFESVSTTNNTKKYQQYKAKVDQLRSCRSKEKLAEPTISKSIKGKGSLTEQLTIRQYQSSSKLLK